ncbi:hypothetical protein [Enterococcus rotai]|uniref:hypothetical protein n=1 Tax=Enterococcus rotai TaxID=118060 RepID=UPI0032B61D00
MNFLITGVSRTGKSTLSKTLYEVLRSSNYSLVPLDPFIDAWKKHEIPKLEGNALERWRELEFSNQCREMIAYAINKLSQPQSSGQKFIFESAHASYDLNHFENLLKKHKISNLCIIQLVHDTKLTPEGLLHKIRSNDSSKDWTFSKPSDELLYKLDCALEANKRVKEYCFKEGREFYVTTDDREDVFDSVKDDLLKRYADD